jgi:hypothetical protein
MGRWKRYAKVIGINGILPSHRILVYEEPTPRAKKDSSKLKNVCDGNVTTKRLYKDGNSTVPINAKLFITSNHVLTFDAGDEDTGIARRFLYYRHKNQFVDERDVDPAKFKFAKVDLIFTEDIKLTIFNYFAWFAKLPKFPAPPQLVRGQMMNNLDKFIDYFCVIDTDGTAVVEDLTILYAKAYPFVEVDKKLVVKKFTDAGYTLNPKGRGKNHDGKLVTSIILGISIKTALLKYCKAECEEMDITEFPDTCAEYEAQLQAQQYVNY